MDMYFSEVRPEKKTLRQKRLASSKDYECSESTISFATRRYSKVRSPSRMSTQADEFFPIENKVFVGGIKSYIQIEDVLDYFSRFGRVINESALRNTKSFNKRGFCFVVFKDRSSVDLVLNIPIHVLKSTVIDCKQALSKEEVKRNPQNKKLAKSKHSKVSCEKGQSYLEYKFSGSLDIINEFRSTLAKIGYEY